MTTNHTGSELQQLAESIAMNLPGWRAEPGGRLRRLVDGATLRLGYDGDDRIEVTCAWPVGYDPPDELTCSVAAARGPGGLLAAVRGLLPRYLPLHAAALREAGERAATGRGSAT